MSAAKTRQERCVTRRAVSSTGSWLVMISVLLTGQASAQNEVALEEIVVTAQRRTENLQDVPIAITAFSEKMIDRIGGNSLSDLEVATPSLNFGNGGRATRGEVTIRGVGSFSRNPGMDARAGVYVDGVFVGRSAVFDQDLQDITSVEILRGPQGTLFGKNTISGAVNINTRKPGEEFSGEVKFDVGNYDYVRIGGNVNIPLVVDKLYANVSLSKFDRDGFVNNIVLDRRINGVDRGSGRLKLRYLASDKLELNFSYDFLDESQFAGNGEAITRDELGAGFSEAPNPRSVSHNLDERESRDFWGTSLTADYSFDSGYTLTSITSYREADWFNRNEEDYSSNDLGLSNFDESNDQFTQELRIASPKTGAFDFVAGLYYVTQDVATSRNALIFGATIATPVEVDAESFAAFVHGNYRFSDKLELTVGARFTREQKDLNYTIIDELGIFMNLADFRDSYDDNAFTPKIGLNFSLNDDTLLYTTISRGFTSGGFNADFLRTVEQIRFDPEFATNYEIGLKSTLLEGRARLNLAGFVTKFDDYQVFQFTTLADGTTMINLTNAGKVTSQGLEGELMFAPVEGLTLTASATYLDEAKFDEFKDGGGPGVDYDGNDLPFAPTWKTYFAAEYEFPVGNMGDGFVRFDYSYTDKYFSNPNNDAVDHLNPDFEVISGRIGFSAENGRWDVALWGKNLSNETYTRYRERNFFGIPRGAYGAPRTYGLNVKVRF